MGDVVRTGHAVPDVQRPPRRYRTSIISRRALVGRGVHGRWTESVDLVREDDPGGPERRVGPLVVRERS